MLAETLFNGFMDSAAEQAPSVTAQEIRSQARKSLFELHSSLGSFNADTQMVTNLRTYLEAEIGLANSKSRAASPKFDLEADKNEQHFNNALSFLKTNGQVGRDAMEDVLLRIIGEEARKTSIHNENLQYRVEPGRGRSGPGQDEAAQRLKEVVLNDQLRNKHLDSIGPLDKAA